MAGINLSQSGEKKRISGGAFMDQGFIVLLVIGALVLAVWGGIRYYMYTISKETAALQSSIESYGAQLAGEKVNRAADISERLAQMEKSSAAAIDVSGLLSQLERLTVPEVRVTKYEYDKAERVVRVSGTTTNFRFVAQQIQSFRSESPLEEIQVEKLGNMDEGKISFILKAALSQ